MDFKVQLFLLKFTLISCFYSFAYAKGPMEKMSKVLKAIQLKDRKFALYKIDCTLYNYNSLMLIS